MKVKDSILLYTNVSIKAKTVKQYSLISINSTVLKQQPKQKQHGFVRIHEYIFVYLYHFSKYTAKTFVVCSPTSTLGSY